MTHTATGDSRTPPPRVPLLAGVFAVAVGGLVLVAWVAGLDGVKSLLPRLPQMKANTALALIGLGAALLLLRDGEDRVRCRVGQALGLAVAVLGLLVLFEYLVAPLGIDELLVGDPGPSPGRPAPHTAIAFVFLGAALATLDREFGRFRPSGWLLGGAAVVVVSALVGYVYDVDFLRATSGTTGIAIHTALALAAVTVGTAWLRPGNDPGGYLRRADLGAVTARRLAAAVVLVPLAIGLARLQSENLGLDAAVGAGLSTLATMAVFLGVVLAIAAQLTRADAERARAEAATADALRRFRSLLEATPDPTVVVDGAGRIAYANLRAGETFGYDAADLVGQPVEQLLPDRFRVAHVGRRASFAANPLARPMGSGRELFARHKDGSELPVEISLKPFESGGEPLVMAAIRDVTDRKRVEARLREAARFFDMSHDLLCTVTTDGWFQQLNGGWERTLGWRPEELRARPFPEFVHPDDADTTARAFEQLNRGVATTVEFVNRCRSNIGDWRWLEWNATAVPEEQLIYASARDVTARVRAEEARREAEERFTQAFEEAPIGMALTDLDGAFIRVNAALCKLTGYAADQLQATDVQSITHPDEVGDDAEASRRMIAGEIHHHHAESRYICSDGEPVPVAVSVTLVRDADGRPLHFVRQAVDMSERKRFEGQLQYLADHDALTGMFNRRRFTAELTRELAVAGRYGNGGALLMLDLDHFKYVNDSLGHSVGDELIMRVAASLDERLRDTDVLGRLGGDEFAIVLPQVDEADALLVADQLRDAIRRVGQVDGSRQVTASIGIAMLEHSAEITAEELMVEADIAMYDAKAAGRDRASVFDIAHGRHERMYARLSWDDRIRHALDNDGFVLHAQPILGLSGDPRPRYELLIRMRGDDGDLIPPGAFLYIAQRFEMIERIDRWVVGEAIRLLAEQQRAGIDICLQLNLSAKSVADTGLPGLIAQRLRATGADPRGLCLEITETAAIVNIERAKRFVSRLRELGCEFALDDFGAGFASFYYLKHLRFDYLKIDGEFISDLPDSDANQLIVKSLVQVAKGLGTRTIAEFVADEQTLELLKRYGVDYAQGFHIAKPAAIVRLAPDGPAALPQLGHPADQPA